MGSISQAPGRYVLTVSQRAANQQLVSSDNGAEILITANSFLQTFAAPAALGSWFCYYRNSGTGTVTLDIAGSPTVAPGGYVLLTCDGVTISSQTLLPSTGYLHVREEQADTVNGGASVNGNQVRTLNTVVTNTIAGASLAANVVTLPAGTYTVRASAPCRSTGGHKATLYNDTDGADILVGTSAAAQNASTQSDSVVVGQFTLAAAKGVRLNHWITGVTAGVGLGLATSSGQIEVYSVVELWKVS